VLEAFLKLLARLPLAWLHAGGTFLGWSIYALSPAYRHRFVDNARLAGYSPAQVRPAIAHAGKMVAEIPRLWWGAPVHVELVGLEHANAAHANHKGLLFLTPHLGCFEVTAQAYAQHYNAQGKMLTVLYRPARKAWLQKLIATSRDRPGLRAAPATLSGLKAMVKALRSGQTLGMLPDQVPPMGLGIWSPFFNTPAYCMTLPAKLAHQTGATVLLAWGERLPNGQGFRVHLRPLNQSLSADANEALNQINQAMEEMIRLCPEQYLWGYARYKQPRVDDIFSPPAKPAS
jgi:Kdo2-lipid IVA lauroyltransferase/acyltransferase